MQLPFFNQPSQMDRAKLRSGILCFLLLLLGIGTQHAFGQQNQIPQDGGDLRPPVDTGNNDFANQGGGGVSGGDGTVEPIELELGNDLEDTRNQGFVGATADRVQELGFVGAASDSSGPPLSENATFGGGVNNSGTQAGGGGGAGGNAFGGGFGNGINGGFGGQNQFGGGTQNGFQVIRRNLRTNMVARFAARPIPGNDVAVRFQQRIARQPVPTVGPQSVSYASATAVQVRIENRTATLMGYANSVADRQRWERQLRLEPGIDKIVNEITILGMEIMPNMPSDAAPIMPSISRQN